MENKYKKKVTKPELKKEETPDKVNMVEVIVMHEQLLKNIINYLIKKPYKDVGDIIKSIEGGGVKKIKVDSELLENK